MTFDDLDQEATYFPVSGVNISQTVRTAIARLLRQLGFLVTFDTKSRILIDNNIYRLQCHYLIV